MTTSGITSNQSTRNTLIAAAMRKIGALSKGQSPDSEDLSNGMHALNSVMMEYQTYGLPLWKRQQYVLQLVAGQYVYGFGTSVDSTLGTPWDEDILWDDETFWDGITTTTETVFPLKIEQAILRLSNSSSQEVFSCSNYEFNRLNTSATGKPNQYVYHPMVNNGTLKIWPVPDQEYSLEITHRSQIEVFTSSTETPDFPQEWTNALVYGLASALAPEYGVPLSDRQMLMKEAERHLDIAKDFDYENSSIYFQLERRY